MGNMTVRNLPDEVHERLRAQARLNKRSLEAEIRSILVQSVISSSAGGFGNRLRERYGKFLGDDLTIERDQSSSEPGHFE